MAIARPIDRRLFFFLDRAHTQMAKAADNFLSTRSGVSTAQAAVLIYLGYNDNCRLSDLAEGTGRKNSAITGLVTRMEKSGLVQRDNQMTDRRSKTVSLTGKGWALREDVMNDFRDFNERLTKGLTDSDIETVLKFLSIGPENLENGIN